jgi:hypothetical protein
MLTLTQSYVVRHLQPEDLPAEVWPDQELTINPHWAWGAFADDDLPIAVLLCAPAHGILIFLRVWHRPGTPFMAMRALIRQAALEAREVGLTRWLVSLEGTRLPEVKIARMIGKVGGVIYGFAGFLGAGSLEVLCRRF